ncbi:unnamed protein product [Schistocephalus solidus]|uniref:Protein kinase domain-containing protein n=1 Tax=Schistocephalus solidus TaxID=70667 RepID=A0A183T7C6_SCHSO|nr:unnamed protein product [Schistocephalus solidus]
MRASLGTCPSLRSPGVEIFILSGHSTGVPGVAVRASTISICCHVRTAEGKEAKRETAGKAICDHMPRKLKPLTDAHCAFLVRSVAASAAECRMLMLMSDADNFTEQDLADLVREMEILKQFDPHPHVVQLYGVCSQNGPLQVLVEFAPYGNLRDFLIVRRPSEVTYGPLHKDKGGGPLLCITPRQLLDFGLQIVHRDLAARNVLIGESYVAKIADFGLTRTACDYYRKCSDVSLPFGNALR